MQRLLTFLGGAEVLATSIAAVLWPEKMPLVLAIPLASLGVLMMVYAILRMKPRPAYYGVPSPDKWRWMWKLEREDVWPIRKLISLGKAAQIAYEATPRSFTAKFAERPGLSPQGVIHAYAHEIVGNADFPIYGIRTPSRKLERIPVEDVLNYQFSDDANSLTDPFDKEPSYSEVSILRRDFRRRLKDIKNRGNLSYGPG